jgi:two-component system chemotaxis response regulator CheB
VAGIEPPAQAADDPLPAAEPAPPAEPPRRVAVDLLLFGASTGGPPALEAVLRDLGPHLPVPALVAQHMPPGFTRAFAERLDASLKVAVREASHLVPLLSSTVYIAPGGKHLAVARSGGQLRAQVLDHFAPGQSSPSVDLLFSSACAAVGGRALAVLLTGMGRDGAAGMADLARAGAHTIAQDEGSSIVYGMPKAAGLAGAVCEELPLGKIGLRLRALLAGG